MLGGIASGKSLVARQLQDLGAAWLDADRAGHQVLRQSEVRKQLRARWGDRLRMAALAAPEADRPAGLTENPETLAAENRVAELERASIARIVFAPAPEGPRELAFLESVTHPLIREVLQAEVDAFQRAGVPAVVLDAALLLEAGWDNICDYLVFIDVPRAVRVARAASRGWSLEEFTIREAAQESLQTKRARADLVIDNSGSPEATRTQVRALWQSLFG